MNLFSHLYTKIKIWRFPYENALHCQWPLYPLLHREGTRPVIIVCEKEYEVDVQEFMLWSILNWRILREEEISSFYEKMASSSNVTIHRSWQDCVQRR